MYGTRNEEVSNTYGIPEEGVEKKRAYPWSLRFCTQDHSIRYLLKFSVLGMGVSKNGGTQQPWVFLLKMIILGCFGGTTILGNTRIFWGSIGIWMSRALKSFVWTCFGGCLAPVGHISVKAPTYTKRNIAPRTHPNSALNPRTFFRHYVFTVCIPF